MDTGFQHLTHGYGHGLSEGWDLNTRQNRFTEAAPFGGGVRDLFRRPMRPKLLRQSQQ
jgi:hypothetical protein